MQILQIGAGGAADMSQVRDDEFANMQCVRIVARQVNIGQTHQLHLDGGRGPKYRVGSVSRR